MKAFVWHENNSTLHGLNPLTKLAACLFAAAVVSTAAEPFTPACVMLLSLSVTRYLGHVPWSVLLRPMIFGLLAGFGLFWTSTVFYVGPGEAWLYGATIAARLVAILSASGMFVLTTDPSTFVRSLIHQARVSPRIAYAVFAAYRFVPLLEVEFDTIRAAHQMRGGVRSSGPLDWIRETIGYAIPLLASSVRTGERVALAMESRGFGALSQRTYYRQTRLGRTDFYFALGCLLAFGLIFALRLHR